MTCTTTDSAPRTAPSRLTLLERWHRRRTAALAAHRLAALDEHLLRDMGIDRSDIAAIVRHGR